MDSFKALAAEPNFLSVDVNTLMGFHIDGEAIFDANMKPLHLQEYETFSSKLNFAAQSRPFKPLPKDATRFNFSPSLFTI